MSLRMSSSQALRAELARVSGTDGRSMSTSARGRRKRPRDHCDSAVAPSSARATSSADAPSSGSTVAISDPATSRHKRPRDRGDSAVAPSSANAPSSGSTVAISTSERHTDSLAHLAAAYAAVDGYALAREEKAAQRAAGVFRDGIQYGEVSAASFARCLEWVTPAAGEVLSLIHI